MTPSDMPEKVSAERLRETIPELIERVGKLTGADREIVATAIRKGS